MPAEVFRAAVDNDVRPKPKRPKPVFETVDANRDGAVTRDELKTALAKRPKMLAKADKLFGRLDKNADGRLDKAEFAAMRKHRR